MFEAGIIVKGKIDAEWSDCMDKGYLAQVYYRKQKAKIRLEGDRKQTYTYETYSWTEIFE